MRNLFKVFMEEHEEGKDLGAGFEHEETQDKDAQKIINKLSGKGEEEEFEGLPSDKDKKDDGEGKLLADKYATVDELKKGIGELKSTLPQYVIDGMSEAALEQHYLELRKEFSSKNRKFEKQNEEPKEGDDKEEEEAKKAIPKELWSDLSKEFESTGSITSEMYDKLEEVGIPSEIVDNYIDSLNQKQVDFTNKVYEIAGSKEQYDVIKAWAEDGGISAAEMKALESMSYDAILGAYEGIKARYDISKGQSSKRIVGNTNSSSSAGYTSQQEYMADVADRRYGQNRAYTEAVDMKFELSNFK